MLAVPSPVVAGALRLLRANRPFTTEAGARRRIRQNALRPGSYGPPAHLRPGLVVDVARTAAGWPLYTVRPRTGAPAGAAVWVHGGGWVNEIAPQHWALAARIAAEARVAVLLPIYPLVPWGTAAGAQRGVVELVRAARERFGPTALAGDSAGGQIALSAALRLRDEGDAPLPVTLVSPALDLTFTNPRIPQVQPTDPWLGVPGGRLLADRWRGDLPVTDPAVSPLSGDPAGLGPITVLTGTRDVLNPDAHLLVERARAAGVRVDLHEEAGELHVYPLLPTRAGARGAAAVVASLRPPGTEEAPGEPGASSM